MTPEMKRLAGIIPQHPSLRQVLSEAGFPPDLHPHELAHAVPGSHERLGHDELWSDYFRKSGEAHHHSHSAHEISAMLKSGELSSESGHHQNAMAIHQHAKTMHMAAGDAAEKAGAPWMKSYHAGHIAKHEKAAGVHQKKVDKESAGY